MNNIFVGNLSFKSTKEDVTKLFEAFGTVANVTIMERKKGKSRGYCFVDMPNEEEKAKAIATLEGREFMERVLVVSPVIPKVPGQHKPKRKFIPAKTERERTPYQSEEGGKKPFRKEERGSKPWVKKEDGRPKTFRKDERGPAPWGKKSAEKTGYPKPWVKKEGATDKPFRKDDRERKPWSKGQDSSKPFTKNKNRPEGALRSSTPFKKFKKTESGSKPNFKKR